MSSDDSIYKLNPTVGCQNVRRSYRDMVPRCELLTIHLESPKLFLGLGGSQPIPPENVITRPGLNIG